MRLTCPNCGAQYEVPDDVIPEEGRDVQCSNCGDTWFQQAAGFVEEPTASATPTIATQAENPVQDVAEVEDTPAIEIGSVSPPEEEYAEDVTQDHQRDVEDDSGRDGIDTSPEAIETQDSSPPAPSDGPDLEELPVAPSVRPTRPEKEAAPQQRGLAPSLSDILREEAEREAGLRAAATSQSLETQPNLGLDDLPEDEDARRSRQAKDHMARLRGEDPRRLAAEASGLKRGVLPDIEEINSTLRASDSAPAPAQNAIVRKPRKSGFTRGFALAILLILTLVMVYSNASQIAEYLPQADPYLSSYVTWVDQARLWLDTQVKALQQPQF